MNTRAWNNMVEMLKKTMIFNCHIGCISKTFEEFLRATKLVKTFYIFETSHKLITCFVLLPIFTDKLKLLTEFLYSFHWHVSVHYCVLYDLFFSHTYIFNNQFFIFVCRF